MSTNPTAALAPGTPAPEFRLPSTPDQFVIARTYGGYRPHVGICERALFVIDSEGIIRMSYVSPIGVNPGADGILTALEALPTKEDRTHDYPRDIQAHLAGERT